LAEKSIALQDKLLETNIKLIFAQISMLQGVINAMHKCRIKVKQTLSKSITFTTLYGKIL
jgi:hypothetical protein